MESLARIVALMALATTGVGATIGGVTANVLARKSKHRTAYTAGGAVIGAVAGWSALVLYARHASSAPVAPPEPAPLDPESLAPAGGPRPVRQYV